MNVSKIRALTFFTIGSGLVAAIGFMIWLKVSPNHGRLSTEPKQTELEKLEKSIDYLRRRVDALQKKSNSSAIAAFRSSTNTRKDSAVQQATTDTREESFAPADHKRLDAESRSPEELAYRATVQADAQLELLEDAIKTEPLDPEWAGSAEGAITEHYSIQDFPDLKLGTKCKSTLCEITFDSSNSNEAMVVVKRMMIFKPWGAQAHVRLQESGVGKYYLAREGFELPRIDPESLTY